MNDLRNRKTVPVVVAFLLGALLVYVLNKPRIVPLGTDIAIASEHAMRPMMKMAASRNADSAVTSALMESAMANDSSVSTRTVAYSYQWTVQTKNRETMKARMDALSKACTDAADRCELLNSNISNDLESPNGSLSMRVAPELVANFKAAAVDGGTMIAENKFGNQMGDQIVDVDRRLAVKESYLQRLNELSQKQGKLEDTLRVQQEISNTVSEIESLKSQQRDQGKQVLKEVVNISYQVPPPAAASTQPLVRAFQDFDSIVGRSTARMVETLAVLVPWLLGLLIVFYIARGVATGIWGFRRDR